VADAVEQVGWTTDQMAERIAAEIPGGAYVNLGIGLPLKIAPYVPPVNEVMFHSENGILGLGPMVTGDQIDEDLLDAGKNYVSLNEGAACFDSSLSFCMMRGGYIDIAIMGGHEVAVNGDLANWTVPGQTPGVGGAMDLAAGARQVWIIMRHLDRSGRSKIVDRCSLPLTGHGVVDRLFTDLGVFAIDADGVTLIELAPNVTWDYLTSVTPVAIGRASS
jgi:3-oxoacid CoA-transferase subunit B